jgi:hypothetical protein
MKLFQIEEPDGSPVDADAPGAAIGIDASGRRAQVAAAVGGNAVVLADREGFEREIPIPPLGAAVETWQAVFEGARLRAERALARPVTHAVVLLSRAPQAAEAARLQGAAEVAGITVLGLPAAAEIAVGDTPALAAAILAEDLAPRNGSV